MVSWKRPLSLVVRNFLLLLQLFSVLWSSERVGQPTSPGGVHLFLWGEIYIGHISIAQILISFSNQQIFLNTWNVYI